MDGGQHYQGERYRILAGALGHSPNAVRKRHNLGEPQHSPGRPGASPGSASVQVWDTLGPALAQAPIPIQILTAPCVNLRSISGLDTNRKYVLGWVGGEAQVAGLGAWPEPG